LSHHELLKIEGKVYRTMNIREAKKLQPGAIVREAYRPDEDGIAPVRGIVIGKTHVEERHHARMLGKWKKERYDIAVHWIEGSIPWCPATLRRATTRLQLRENWDLIVISHVG